MEKVMTQEIRLPRSGRSMSQATVVHIKVRPGQPVGIGDVLCELETDKAAFELESPANGTIAHIFPREGQTLPVNAPLFLISDADEKIDAGAVEKLRKEFDSLASSLQTPVSADITRDPGGEETLEQEFLAKIRPATGPIGSVKDFSATPAFLTGVFQPGQTIPLSRWQQIIAGKMLYSKQHIPCFYLNIRADVTGLVDVCEELNRGPDGKYAIDDFIILSLAGGLKHYPIMTGRLGTDCIYLADSIDIGLTIAADNGHIAPVIHDAGSKNLRQISDYRRDLIERTGKNALTIDDLTGGCITVSNLGGLGIDSFIPIVIPGQCSILGVGRIFEMAVPDGPESVQIRKKINLNLSVDHRIVNGADAAQFLDFVKKQLEHSQGLLDS